MPAADVAIVVTTHSEGRLMLPTFRSLAAAVNEAADCLVKTEIAIVEDKADDATRTTVERILDSGLLARATQVQVIPTDHGDLSLARNSGITATSAPYVGVLDADNLISPNWIHAARERIISFGGDCVVHPAHMLTFDLSLTYSEIFSCGENRTRLGFLNRINLWDAFMLTTRAVTDAHPYPLCRPESGFGPEDWAWNCATLDAGISHVTAPDTSFFYQVRSLGSLRVAHSNSLLPKADVLGDKEIAAFEDAHLDAEIQLALSERHAADSNTEAENEAAANFVDEPETSEELNLESQPSMTRRAVDYVRNNSLLVRLAYNGTRNLARKAGLVPTPPTAEEIAAAEAEIAAIKAAEEAARLAALPSARKLPVEHWELAHQLQPLIPKPTEELRETVHVNNFVEYSMNLCARYSYWKAIHAFPTHIDALIVTPHISNATVALSHHLTAEEKNVAILVTNDLHAELDTPISLPESVTVCRWKVDVDPRFEFARMLGQLAVQLAPREVLIIDSALGNETVERYHRAISYASNIRCVFSEHLNGENAARAVAGCSKDYLKYVQACATSETVRDDVAQAGGFDKADISLCTLPPIPAQLPVANQKARTVSTHKKQTGTSASTRLRYWCSNETRALLDANRTVFLYTGADGTSNFGDILQNKNILNYWQARPDATPLLLVPTAALDDSGRLSDLQHWYTPNILAFGMEPPAPHASFIEMMPTEALAALHIVGGGYLNSMWGSRHYAAIEAIASDWKIDSILASGLQVDAAGAAGLASLQQAGLPLRSVGFRDYLSLDIAQNHGIDNARFTFDDLTEILQKWAGSNLPLPPSPSSNDTLILHINTSHYAGKNALHHWRSALTQLSHDTSMAPIVLDAYSDRLEDVTDSLRSVANLAEAFPFTDYRVISTAQAALNWQAGAGLPTELTPLRGAWAGLASSYHTALLLGFLGTPAYLVSSTPYFSQKAAIFNLPSLEDFLACPSDYPLNLDKEIAARTAWLEELNSLHF